MNEKKVAGSVSAVAFGAAALFTAFYKVYNQRNSKDKDNWKSQLVLTLMKSAGISIKEMSSYLGFEKDQPFRNKLSRDSFSMDDILVIADICGFSLTFAKKSDSNDAYVLDPNKLYLVDKDGLRKKIAKAKVSKREAYDDVLAKIEELKKQAEEMNKQFHFDEDNA